eukprot:TRINITY_DN6719_c0_g2_i1.p1 TRINITY_DN6719_c0_g2~~TRINITY_DN6719_c0_g2_i1.p1  ORF type:complete len:244 (+),score=47.87 TRINITY_DN6719_c0_g2_i1:66-797(+)
MASAGDDAGARRTFRPEPANSPVKRGSVAGRTNEHASPGGEVSDGSQYLVAKVVMLGDSGVGKSSLVIRYVDNQFSNVVKSTVGASFFTKRFMVDGSKVKLQIWDTAGQERFRSMAPMFYRGAAAAIVVFDVTSEQSFEKLKGWVSELRQNTEDNLVIAIAANKTDMVEQRRVQPKRVQEYSESIRAAVFETSARLNTGVDELFSSVAKQLVMVHRSSPAGSYEPATQVQTTNSEESTGGKCC